MAEHRYIPAPALSEHELSEIRSFVEHRSGMHFDHATHGLFSGRVREHIASRRLSHAGDLLRLMQGSNQEYELLLERLLTREDSFFRHPEMFAALEKTLLPEIKMRKFWDSPRSLRVWSAACGAGHQAYSIALTITTVLELDQSWTVYLLASDLSRQAIQHAQRGVYSRGELASLTTAQMDSAFARIGDQFLVKPCIRNLINFAVLNVADCAYMGQFDCIFCTDLLRYFPEDRRQAVARRLYDYLEPGGYLFLNQADVPDGLPGTEISPAADIAICRKPQASPTPTVA
jgi:chemotaxis protein methyltransferase CheR